MGSSTGQSAIPSTYPDPVEFPSSTTKQKMHDINSRHHLPRNNGKKAHPKRQQPNPETSSGSSSSPKYPPVHRTGVRKSLPASLTGRKSLSSTGTINLDPWPVLQCFHSLHAVIPAVYPERGRTCLCTSHLQFAHYTCLCIDFNAYPQLCMVGPIVVSNRVIFPITSITPWAKP